MDATDVDLGSGGAVAIGGTYIVGGGKDGNLSVINTQTMGLVQRFQADKGLWGSPVFWSGGNTLYVWGVNDSLKAFTYNPTTHTFNTPFAAASSVTTPDGFDPCGALSISSNQSQPGTTILWATIPLGDPDHQSVPGRLYAFDATNISTPLWSSDQNATRDALGNFAKFAPPTVANGKVYVATDSYQVCAYGLNPPTPSPDGTVLLAGQAGRIVDAAFNIWTIQTVTQTVHGAPLTSPTAFENINLNADGAIAGYNYNVAELAYKSGVIWVENTSSQWYSSNGSSSVAGTKPL